jgi:drug/metabolite transporter, DME family
VQQESPGEQAVSRQPGRHGGSAAVVAILLGAAAWGSTGTVAHFAPASASPVSIGAARIVLGGGLLLVLAIRNRAGRKEVAGLLCGSAAIRLSVLLASVAMAGYQLCFFAAVQETGVAIGTIVAIGSAPVLAGVITRLTGGPAQGRRWLIATAAAVAGCAVLISGGQSAGVNLPGVGLALLAGLSYACYAVAAARLIAGGDREGPGESSPQSGTGSPTTVMGLLFGGAAVLLTPVLAATSAGWLGSARGLAIIGYLGVVTTVVAYLLYGSGLRTVPAPVAVTLGLAEPAVAALLGLLVLSEQLTGQAVAGLVLIGSALAILTVGRRTARPADADSGQLPGGVSAGAGGGGG